MFPHINIESVITINKITLYYYSIIDKSDSYSILRSNLITDLVKTVQSNIFIKIFYN